MKAPLVSIVIPTFNRTLLLKQTLVSVISQTYKNIEVWVVDDGSSGKDNELLCASFDKVNYIKISNTGSPCKPRNIGIDKAKGKYIAFLDDDDLWVENRLELMVDILENKPEYGLVHCYCELIDLDGKSLHKFVGKPGTPKVKHGTISKRMIGNWTISDYPLTRTKLIKEIGYFNEKMKAAGEDVEYWARASFFTKFYYLDLPLTKYRIHEENNSKVNQKLYLELNLFMKTFLDDFLKQKIITTKNYKIFIQSLSENQIKIIKKGVFKSLYVLHKLNKLWFLKYRNFKLLVFIIIKR
ncbi:glycosyltransferase family A protein [uncultured Polaribacter sp.]|uniref:glycosyltransferase family 2 protein n=1 Tax=uncultured Polaribacter sp. TaxID=174711 RepID=UPI0026350A5A|nr:glycosyltransferase family A protein [uncultured Polaribacter sp.]